MKSKNVLIAICLMLLMELSIGGLYPQPAMALDMGSQLCTGVGYFNADASMAEYGQAKLVTQTSKKTFILLKGQGAVEPSVAQGFDIGAEFGVLVTNRLMVRTSVGYQQTYFMVDAVADTANTKSPLISLGADYFFSDVLIDDNEIIGVTLSIIYNSDTKETGIFGGLLFWFGKDNTQ